MSGIAPVTRRRFGRLIGACSAALVCGPPRGRTTPLARAIAPQQTDGLKLRAGRVIELLQRHVQTGYLAGAVALIGTGNRAEVVTVGVQSLEDGVLMRRESIFRITSMTKPITAVATLMLVNEGKLRLDERIDDWLPELAHRRVLRRLEGPLDDTVSAKRPITVEDLLTFRCGLGSVTNPDADYPLLRRIAELQLLGFGPPEPATTLRPDEWLRRLGTLPLMAQPGETWLYNTGACILGVLLARVARKPLPLLLKERIFDPLGMTDTDFVVPAAKRERLVSAYRPEAGRAQLYDAPATSPWETAPAFPDAAAGLVSTADDYFAFSHFLLGLGQSGSRRLLVHAAINAMTRDHLDASQRASAAPIVGSHRGWGFGVAVVTETTVQGIPAGAYGWNGGFGTSWVADPSSGTTAILLTQTLFASPTPPAVHQEFWAAVFSPAVF